jgi:flagellar biosynthesis/type III secretory pathway protein FliH
MKNEPKTFAEMMQQELVDTIENAYNKAIEEGLSEDEAQRIAMEELDNLMARRMAIVKRLSQDDMFSLE